MKNERLALVEGVVAERHAISAERQEFVAIASVTPEIRRRRSRR